MGACNICGLPRVFGQGTSSTCSCSPVHALPDRSPLDSSVYRKTILLGLIEDNARCLNELYILHKKLCEIRSKRHFDN